jgi:hypothetical protein
MLGLLARRPVTHTSVTGSMSGEPRPFLPGTPRQQKILKDVASESRENNVNCYCRGKFSLFRHLQMLVASGRSCSVVNHAFGCCFFSCCNV